ncbi:hypothetical protein, partial [Siminovitchia fortis]|uniref:hypothetical protein n=1 Tax=Siminovitchia fortis TaxID=254758 RepID=UPI0011A4A793
MGALDEGVSGEWEEGKDVVDGEKRGREVCEHIGVSEQEMYEVVRKKEGKEVEFGGGGRDLSEGVKEE